jgi:undecaprenyl-diphosphatase
MNALQAAILGLIQGLTEFLPVSSSGHLLLGSFILGLPAPGLSLSVLLHLGTAFATVVMLWDEIVWLLRGLLVPASGRQRARALTIVGLLIVASIPGAMVGLFFGDFLDAIFSSGGVAAVGLILTGFVLRWAGRLSGRHERASADSRIDGHSTPEGQELRSGPSRRTGRRSRRGHGRGSDERLLDTVNLRRAVIVGLSQAVAVIPGISRSGATMASGLVSGMEREDAARFSFLLALPAIFGGALLDFRQAISVGESVVSPLGLLGALVAFAAGIFALSLVFRVVRKGDLSKFAYYCWAAGAASLIYLMFRP